VSTLRIAARRARLAAAGRAATHEGREAGVERAVLCSLLSPDCPGPVVLSAITVLRALSRRQLNEANRIRKTWRLEIAWMADPFLQHAYPQKQQLSQKQLREIGLGAASRHGLSLRNRMTTIDCGLKAEESCTYRGYASRTSEISRTLRSPLVETLSLWAKIELAKAICFMRSG
jgi:hypothetical protein